VDRLLGAAPFLPISINFQLHQGTRKGQVEQEVGPNSIYLFSSIYFLIRSLLEAEGVERLVFLTQQKRRFSPRVVKFASQVLYSLWQHQVISRLLSKQRPPHVSIIHRIVPLREWNL